MIWVLISGWLLVAVAAAAVFHVAHSRYRPYAIPAEAQQFLRQLETEIVENHPEYEIRGMVPGRFTLVLGLQGQELPRACTTFIVGTSRFRSPSVRACLASWMS